MRIKFYFSRASGKWICMKTVISQLTTLPHLIPILDPKASNCSDIWKANSLVGVKINAYSRWGLSSNVCSIGKAKEPVFPEPVSARPIISFPEKKCIDDQNSRTTNLPILLKNQWGIIQSALIYHQKKPAILFFGKNTDWVIVD